MKRRFARVAEGAAVLALLGLGLGLRMRVGKGWAYGGSDTYGMMKCTVELLLHHRYALGPEPEPLYYARPPGYSMFLAVVWHEMKDWWPIVRSQIWIDLLGTGLLVYALARWVRGRLAGLLALALAMICPFTLVYTSAAFTETLAMFFTTATVALLLIGGEWRTRWRWFAAGACAGLGALLRQDGVIVAVAFLPALMLVRGGRREMLTVAALASVGFAVTFGPWPLRNLYQFKRPYLLGEHADRLSHPLPHFDGYFHWMASWAEDAGPVPALVWCFYDRTCHATTINYPMQAFEDSSEALRVAELFDERNRDGITASVAAGFERLAAAHRAHRPFHVLVELPLQRMWNLWDNRHDDILRSASWRPWPTMWARINPFFEPTALAFTLLLIASLAVGLASAATRPFAATIGTLTLVRTAVLAYTYNVESRYVVEVMPIGFALIGAAAATVGILLRRTRIGARKAS